MKRLKLFKTLLLVAVMLLGGANSVWAGALTTMTGIVGPTDNTGAFSANHSKEVTLAAGDSYSYTFVNYNKGVDGTNEYETWTAECKKSDALLYLTFCSDGRLWGELATTKTYTGSVWTGISSTKNVFLQAYNGVTVNFTVSRSADGATITMTHTATTNAVADPAIASTTYSGTVTATVNASDEIIFYLMNEASHQNITKVVYTGVSGGGVYLAPEHTAGSQWGSNKGASTVDAVMEHYNNDGDSGWAGCAYAKFSYPELPDGITITAATMYYSVNQGGKSGRDDIIYYMEKEFDLDWANFAGQTDTDLRNTANRAGQAVAAAPTGGTGDRLNLNQSVFTSVSAIYTAGQKYILFQWTKNEGGADLYGKTSEHAPSLEIAYTSETRYTATFTETNSLSPVVTIYSDAGMTSPVTNGTLENGTTYYYKAVLYGYNDVTGNFTVSGANPSINITMTAKATYNYSLKYKLGTADAVEQEAGTMYVDETETIYYPICRQDASGNYYVVSKNNSAPYFGVVISSSNNDVTINYTLDEVIVYYAESENMNGTRYNYGQAASYSSNGGSWCSSAADNSYIATKWSVAAGYYDIEVGMANRQYSVNPAPKLMTSSTDESPTVLGEISLSANSYTQKTYLSQQIAEGQNLYIFNDNGSNASKWALDYVILRSSPTSVSKTITSAGWATYCSPYPLDFSGDIANLNAAYLITTGDGTYVTKTEITGTIPANTGILLKGEGEVTIPVAASSSTDVSSNKLIGVTTATTLDLDDNDDGTADTQIYVLLNETTGEKRGIGFYLTETSVTSFSLGANTAYLPSNFAGGVLARGFFSLADDETTGINMVHGEGFKVNGAVYNLNGQRIDKPIKGLYISGGKKFIVK